MRDEVSLQPLPPAQFHLAATWLAEPEINRWLYSEWRGRDVDEKLVAIVAMNSRNRLYLVGCGEVPVGLVALSEINRTDCSAAVWYLLGVRALGGRSVISTGLKQLCLIARERFQLHTLHASVIDGNAGSIRVLENCGFAYVGRFRQAFKLGELFADRLLYDRVIEST
jgi:ribosomal-protein-alanine N-acetyltransferase